MSTTTMSQSSFFADLLRRKSQKVKNRGAPQSAKRLKKPADLDVVDSEEKEEMDRAAAQLVIVVAAMFRSRRSLSLGQALGQAFLSAKESATKQPESRFLEF